MSFDDDAFENPTIVLWGGEDVDKAQFATRSEAARYAAQQRWKGHVKEEGTGDPELDALLTRAKDLRARGEQLRQLERVKESTVDGYLGVTDALGVALTDVNIREPDSWFAAITRRQDKHVVPSQIVMDFEQDSTALGRDILAYARKKAGIQSFEIEQQLKDVAIRKATEELDAIKAEIDNTERGRELKATLAKKEEIRDTTARRLLEVREGRKEAEQRLRALEDEWLGELAGKLSEGVRSSSVSRFLAANPDKKNLWDGLRKDVRDAYWTERALKKQVKMYGDAAVNAAMDIVAEYKKNMSYITAQMRLEKAQTKKIPNPMQAVHEVVLGILKQSRDFSSDPIRIRTDSTGLLFEKHVNENVPSAWRRAVNSAGTVTVVKNDSVGGSYQPMVRTIDTSDETETNLHEFIHAACDSDVLLGAVEKAVLSRRVYGRAGDTKSSFVDKLKYGRQKPRFGFEVRFSTIADTKKVDANNLYFKDKFTFGYSGRHYGDGGSEVLTTAHDMLMGRSRSYWVFDDDEDLMAAVVGAMMTV